LVSAKVSNPDVSKKKQENKYYNRGVLKTKNGKKDINAFFHPYKNMGDLPMDTPLLHVIGDTTEMKKWKHDDRLEALDILMKHCE
jgi:hypothetical protein